MRVLISRKWTTFGGLKGYGTLHDSINITCTTNERDITKGKKTLHVRFKENTPSWKGTRVK